MTALLAVILIARVYWTVDCARFANQGSAHTHVEVTGWVKYATLETDGDLHIAVVPAKGTAAPFFIAECIPGCAPCAKPKVGAKVMIRGISRRDPEHGWFEIHPVETIEVMP